MCFICFSLYTIIFSPGLLPYCSINRTNTEIYALAELICFCIIFSHFIVCKIIYELHFSSVLLHVHYELHTIVSVRFLGVHHDLYVALARSGDMCR